MSSSSKTDGVPQSLADMGTILSGSVVVPRENKLLARKTVADRANDAEDCKGLLEALGLLDLDTLQEPA
jgi:hypothetical protein